GALSTASKVRSGAAAPTGTGFCAASAPQHSDRARAPTVRHERARIGMRASIARRVRRRVGARRRTMPDRGSRRRPRPAHPGPVRAPRRVLIVGCGTMGSSHARAYRRLDRDFAIVGLVSRGPESRERLARELGGPPTFADWRQALAATRPDVVSINTYPDTHEAIAREALLQGAHLFVEKPLAETEAQAQALVELARRQRKKVVVGYILRVHPACQKFI